MKRKNFPIIPKIALKQRPANYPKLPS